MRRGLRLSGRRAEMSHVDQGDEIAEARTVPYDWLADVQELVPMMMRRTRNEVLSYRGLF